MPKIFTIQVVESASAIKMLGQYDYYSLVAQVTTLPTNIPSYPNIREANPKAEVCKDMVMTLISTPERFIQYNDGITITAKSVKSYRKDGKHKIDIEILEPYEGYDCYGICNGAHTLKGIELAHNRGVKTDNAYVKLTIYSNFNDTNIAKEIALKINTVTPIDKRSKINAAGGFDSIKKSINNLETHDGKPFNHIAYYQNQGDVEGDKYKQCSINHVFKLVNPLDLIKYNYNIPGKPHPKTLPTLTSKELARMERLVPILLQDAFWIEKRLFDEINKYLKNQQTKGVSTLTGVSMGKKNDVTKLIDGSLYGFKAIEGISTPIIAAYRVMLQGNYEWIVPFKQLREPLFQILWRRYQKELKELKIAGATTSAAIQKNDKIWNNLCELAINYRSTLIEGTPQLINVPQLVLN